MKQLLQRNADFCGPSLQFPIEMIPLNTTNVPFWATEPVQAHSYVWCPVSTPTTHTQERMFQLLCIYQKNVKFPLKHKPDLYQYFLGSWVILEKLPMNVDNKNTHTSPPSPAPLRRSTKQHSHHPQAPPAWFLTLQKLRVGASGKEFYFFPFLCSLL